MTNQSDFPETGGPRRLGERMRPISASIPTTAPNPSPTTSARATESGRNELQPAGKSAGESGAIATPLGRWVVAKLAPFALPEETMRSMSNSLVSQLETRTESAFGKDGQFEGTKLAPFTIADGWDRRALTNDLGIIVVACRGGKRAEIAQEVAKLLIRTKSRAQGEGEARLMAETLVSDLAQYPTDVVKFACEYWVEGGAENKWTPSWPELKEICDKRMDGRLRLKKALEHHLSVTVPL